MDFFVTFFLLSRETARRRRALENRRQQNELAEEKKRQIELTKRRFKNFFSLLLLSFLVQFTKNIQGKTAGSNRALSASKYPAASPFFVPSFGQGLFDSCAQRGRSSSSQSIRHSFSDGKSEFCSEAPSVHAGLKSG